MTAPFDALFATYARAARARDVEAMVALYAEDVLDFDMWADWTHDGAASMRTMIAGWFDGLGSDQVAITFGDIRTWPGPDLAAATAIITYRGLDAAGAELRSMQNRLSWVVARRAEGWRIVHQHTSAPISPETTAAIFHRPPA